MDEEKGLSEKALANRAKVEEMKLVKAFALERFAELSAAGVMKQKAYKDIAEEVAERFPLHRYYDANNVKIILYKMGVTDAVKRNASIGRRLKDARKRENERMRRESIEMCERVILEKLDKAKEDGTNDLH